MTSISARGAATASAVIYAAAIAYMARPVVASLGTAIAGDVGDPMLNAAILAWNARNVPWTEAWYQFPGFHPSPDALTFSEHLLGVSVIASPVYWISGNALLAYNLTLLIGYVLAGVCMFALVHRLTGSPAAAFLSGLAFAFAPYRASQIAHIQALIVFWAPLALLGAHAYLDTHRKRWLVLFGGAWALQGAANSYLLVYFSVFIGLWMVWFVIAPRRWRDLGALAGALAGGAVFLAPVLLRYVAAHAHYGYSRPQEEIAGFGADLAGVLCASDGLKFWKWLQTGCRPEGQLFPGVALLAICLAGAWWGRRTSAGSGAASRRSIVGFYAAAAIVMWMLAWGPEPKLQGERLLPFGLYSLLQLLPGLDGLRVPARFWMMSVLSLAVLAGFASAAILRGRKPFVTAACVLAAGVALLADGWALMHAAPILPPPPNEQVLRDGNVLTLPLGSNRDIDINAQFRAVTGGWRSINGFSGYEPFHYDRLRRASAEEDPLVLAPFINRGDLHVVLAPNAGSLVRLVEEQPGATELEPAGEWRQFRIPRQGRYVVTAPAGERLNVASVSASCSTEMLPHVDDDDYTTRWQCGPQTPGQEFIIDLGRSVTVGTIVPALGVFRTDQPRQLLIETSTDGNAWEQAWNGDVRPEMLLAEMLAPLEIRMILPFTPRPARYLRLRLVGEDPVFYWSIAEFEVWSGGAMR